MKKIFNIAICAVALFSLTSCEKFFTRTPWNEFDAETYFSSESELKMYTDGFLNSWLPDYTETDGDDAYNDLIATKTSTDFFRADTQWDGAKQGSWTWTWLRRINFMIVNMEKNAKDKVDEATYNHYLGLARFWRAYHYVTRVKLFSDVPWIDTYVQPQDTLILYGQREDREYVFHNIVEDLKFACENVDNRVHATTPNSRNQVDKYVVNAMAARILLYEGTFRKNHGVNPATNMPWTNQYETPDDLIRLSAQFSKYIIDSGAFKLYKGDWSDLFLSKELVTDEVLWGQVFIMESNGRHAYTRYFNSSTLGQQYSGTKELLHHFLKVDGTPIDSDYKTINQEFEGRDSRLAKTILGPGHTVADLDGSAVLQPINCTFCWTAYMIIKWCVPDKSHWQNSVDENCIPIIRYAEVLLNYAEAVNELGEFNVGVWNQTVGALRERAGVKSIYPAESDPWLKDYYTRGLENQHITDGNEAVALEIRRERVTELCFEAESRQPDLYRWGICDIIPRRGGNGNGWTGVWLTADDVKNGFTFNGEKYTFNETVKKGTETAYPITGTNNSCWSLEPAGNGYFLVYNYKLKWEDRMYCRPIPVADQVLNPNLGQNYGWE